MVIAFNVAQWEHNIYLKIHDIKLPRRPWLHYTLCECKHVGQWSILFVVLLTLGKHFNDLIISLRGEVCNLKTSIIPPLFIKVNMPSQKSEQSCICLLGVSILPLFKRKLSIRFWTVQKVCHLLFITFFSFTIVFSVHLQLTISDYPFSISKLSPSIRKLSLCLIFANETV